MKRLKYALAGLLLLAVAAVGALLLFPERIQFVNASLVLKNRLAIPTLAVPRIENGEKVFELTAQTGEMAFLKDRLTRTLGFSGSYLGPTIRARQGDKVRVLVTKYPRGKHDHTLARHASAAGNGRRAAPGHRRG